MLLGINIYCDNGYVFVILFMLLGISIALTLLCLSYTRVWIPMFDWFEVWEVVIRFCWYWLNCLPYHYCLYFLFII